MPNLKLGRLHPELDSIMVWAAMCYPQNQAAREAFFTVHWVDYVLEYEGDNWRETISPFMLKILLNSPSIFELKERQNDIISQAHIAGDVLVTLYQLVMFGVKEPSLRKSFYLVAEHYKSTTRGDGSSIHTSDANLRKAWKKYMPVAHLWAALMTLRYNESQHDLMFKKGGLPTFLMIAEEYRRFGETFKPSRQETTTPLDPKRTWKVPERYPLPAGNIQFEEMPKPMQALLHGYGARDSHYK